VLAVKPKEAEDPAAAAGAPVVSPQTLLAQFLKGRGKVAELEALVASGAPKAQRKLAEQLSHQTALEQQLRALNVDVDAALAEQAVLARTQQWHEGIKAAFDAAWAQKLTETGRADLAAALAEDPVQAEAAKRAKRVTQTPLELAREKLARLKLKVEREEFRVEWLAARDAQLAAELQQLRQPAAPAA
jgi:hypothetical protein